MCVKEVLVVYTKSGIGGVEDVEFCFVREIVHVLTENISLFISGAPAFNKGAKLSRERVS